MEWLDSFWATYSTLVLSVGTNILLALSIYLTLACGLLTVANAAFMGIGAYAAALLTINGGIPFFFAITAGALLPALIALVIGRPTLRLSGVYLAMATLAFGEVVRILILNAESITGGALGLNGIPLLTTWLDVTLAVGVMLYVLLRLAHARIGRAMTAIRQDEVATELMGINVRAYKLFSFVLGAALAGLAGALNAHFTFFISPNEYGFERGVEILAMGVLGGATSPWGALIGAALVTLLPELLRGLGHYRSLINGVILIVIILYSPKGLWELLQFAMRRPRPSTTS
ncbi:MAG TPA: branched-chain amino acid ABC transporter permease [Candidatus Limnocylindrales bacterium]|jgi:branched-chain amino acid transport system permease protein|nr:branched-chain amino acid ABC transporter permease [Candidatus Limnocylindrales bacterium]